MQNDESHPLTLEPPTHLRVELNEIEEDDVLSAMLDGQVEGVASVGLEYLIEQGGTHLSKVTGVEVVLGSVREWSVHGWLVMTRGSVIHTDERRVVLGNIPLEDLYLTGRRPKH